MVTVDCFLAVDNDGTEWIYKYEPQRGEFSFDPHGIGHGIMLPPGSIKKLIGIELSWEDEPFRYSAELCYKE